MAGRVAQTRTSSQCPPAGVSQSGLSLWSREILPDFGGMELEEFKPYAHPELDWKSYSPQPTWARASAHSLT